MGSRRNLDYQKRSFKAAYEEEEGDEEEVEGEEEEEEEEESESKRIRTVCASSSSSKKLGSSTGGPGAGGWVPTARAATCQADNCTANMLEAKQYHRRHKVCEFHAKAPVVLITRIRQRFCQQCSRFHELSEFDETKRSCRRRLAGHNERRRKSSSEVHGEGASD